MFIFSMVETEFGKLGIPIIRRSLASPPARIADMESAVYVKRIAQNGCDCVWKISDFCISCTIEATIDRIQGALRNICPKTKIVVFVR